MSTITPAITLAVVPSNPSYTPPSYFFPMDLGTYLLATVKGKIGTNAVQELRRVR